VSGYPVAFVDEAYIHKQGHPGVYLLAAVLAEGEEVDALEAAARSVVTGVDYHSVDLYHRGHVGVIETMLDAVEAHAAWTAVVAHTPLGPSGEIARQTSLRRLLGYLDKQRVRDVLLDVRGDEREWQTARAQGLKMPAINHRDMRSYRHMVTNKEISSRMRLQHVNDRQHPGLWMADAVAWSARRALAADEPQWWLRVSSAATVLEAVSGRELRIEDNRAALPIGEYGPHSPGQSAQAMLLPVQGPHPEYPATQPSRTGPAGRILTQLIAQADNARNSGQLLDEVRELSQRVADLTRQIHDLTAAGPEPEPRGGHPPDPSTARDAGPVEREID
jgi:hypothetical protein